MNIEDTLQEYGLDHKMIRIEATLFNRNIFYMIFSTKLKNRPDYRPIDMIKKQYFQLDVPSQFYIDYIYLKGAMHEKK
jgi:hypothetical protein